MNRTTLRMPFSIIALALMATLTIAHANPAKPLLHGKHWMAITGKPLGASAGARIFYQGGNAVDATCAMLAANSSTLHREACSMVAMCHRERQELAQAAEWYRQALEQGTVDDEAVPGIRYDLAEVLLQGGDAEQALALFRGVLEIDPAVARISSVTPSRARRSRYCSANA